ncbi:d93fb746-ea7a-438c-9de3-3f3300b42097 [Thermothielavioides terrestris]|uniref:D93fb746-ea7a-438c-9de3-3f3300b42097 n=1 Tax=Thermothielavioides terrestris TaxID=2587410 RepID=A0A446BJQ4_9PEZI|nr:d93fb746-ea7a-438c-9de3-3f3300b42097 [Thermothielavioides terrestris]
MSYYFVIIGTQDNPLFEYEFGTSKQGGDGQAHFTELARHLNQFIVHSSLDIVEEVQWANGQLYLKVIDKFFANYISCFITGGNVKFLLLHQPTATATATGAGIAGGSSSGAATSTRSSTSVGANPTSPQTEEAIKNFFNEVYDNYVKAIMNPFYRVNMEIRSPVFRQRVAAAGRKYL